MGDFALIEATERATPAHAAPPKGYAMNPKSRVQAILSHQPVDRLPVDIWHTPEVLATLKRHFGTDDDLDLYRKMGIDKIVWVFMDYKAAAGEGGIGSQDGTTRGGTRTMWGVPLKEVDTGSAVYQEVAHPPLLDYPTLAALDDYPYWPDPAQFDYDKAAGLARRAAADFCTLGPWVSHFEVYCQLRGIEQSLMDLMLDPDYVNAALDRIDAIQTAMMKRFLDQSARDLTMVFISDDMGMQRNLMLSLETWDFFFKERLRRWCELIHSYGLKVFFHTDGAVEPLIPRLIGAGIDVLNPIQHVCPGMELEGLKRNYGRDLVFHGGIDNQGVLPFGSPEDVRREVMDCRNTLGAGREGWICCSCHNIQPVTPLPNILALIDAMLAPGND